MDRTRTTTGTRSSFPHAITGVAARRSRGFVHSEHVIVPDSSGSRYGRAIGRALGCAALSWSLAACGAAVSGHPIPARDAAHTPGALNRLLPGQDEFPARYSTVVLSPDRARRAAGDVRAMPEGAQVDPADCGEATPSFEPDRGAIAVGTDNQSRATLTVELTRTDTPLTRLRERLQRCATVRVTRGPITNTVVTQLDPPPPGHVDEALALRRTVTGQTSGPGLTRTLQTLIGQIGDVRVAVTYMSYSDARADTEGLDQVFTAAVADVRRG
ncbi:PknH-like protein [Nocardia pseudobrasiliensis]|uniref:PknH-like protein n=1 Tax=Nocardia pseudobrasiliensis TaxID=45979 RepID=A0A370I1X1_9NOCA|nr:PknH-like protein [Nocardia pseudobrasiliensis]